MVTKMAEEEVDIIIKVDTHIRGKQLVSLSIASFSTLRKP